MRTIMYYAGCAFVVFLFVIGLLSSCHARADIVPALPHTVADGRCELWEARYRSDDDAMGWVHFDNVIVRGYSTCDDCDVVGRFAVASARRRGQSLLYYCVMRVSPTQTIIQSSGSTR